jgi:hypothetical protein
MWNCRLRVGFLFSVVLLTMPAAAPALITDGKAAVPNATAAPSSFTRLTPLPSPTIVESAVAFGGYAAANITDGVVRTEYSSDGKGTNTYIEFDFGRSTRIAAFRHVDRADDATVGSSELTFRDDTNGVVATVPVFHTNKPGSETVLVLPSPVTARYVRWQVASLCARGHTTVGGAEIVFFTTTRSDPSPLDTMLDITAIPVIERRTTAAAQTLRLSVDYPYAEPVEAMVRVQDAEPKTLQLRLGSQALEVLIPAAHSERTLKIALEVAGKAVLERDLQLTPIRKSVVYILPHSHVDIGYTELQTNIERKQMANIAKGIELARETAGYPEGARYKWNVEVLWAVESYLRQSSPKQQEEFIEAVRKGWIGFDAMYGNELTGLCRPEELIRLFGYAARLSGRCGLPIESAMSSDVPGYTWGVVSAMAQAGVKYWSIGPNYIDTIGTSMVAWENKPFYWIGPSGRDKVLCWVPYQGYAISHILRSDLTPGFLFDLMAHLEKIEYPYDLVHLRWSGHGDNAAPDEKIPPFVRAWNDKYESPKLVIATTAEAFREFERRYGDKLPRYSGDWTPYWENGAASSARETAVNRASAERLTQAGTLWAMLDPTGFPAAEFHDAWRNILLYSEHTWGAHNSITEPESQFVKDQWKIKRAFALDGEAQSVKLLDTILTPSARQGQPATDIDVFNTTCWQRTDLVMLRKELSAAGNKVIGPDGKPVPSQRLSSGELAFMAEDVPAFGAKRYSVLNGLAFQAGQAAARESMLDNGVVSVRLDPGTGAIAELRARELDVNLADAQSIALNDYFFVAGSDTQHPLRSGPVRISIKESGPLVASLLVESAAPGCNSLAREVRLVAGLDRVEITNLVDKKRADVRGKPNDLANAGREAKEGLHFGFAFHVPGGIMRMDVPWAVVRPETDQLPGACKNWFTVQRWVDVSNNDYGVTWSSVDAPLVEVGAITANLLGSQTNPKAWISRLEPTQTFYSMVMNNHWHTNYRAYQEGPTTFRYAIRPHRGFNAVAATRFGAGLSQPLIVAPAIGRALPEPRLHVEPDDILVTALEPSGDSKALIVRLFGASGRTTRATLRWSDPAPRSLWLSNTSEKPIEEVTGPIDVPVWGIVTLRAVFSTNG